MASKKAPRFVKAIFFLAGFALAAGTLFAWSPPPSGTPPTCPSGQPGCDAPINVGNTLQSKDGNLMVNAGGSFATGFSVPFGNVGIGEVAPGSKLSVSGGATVGASYDTTVAPTNGMIIEGSVGIGTTGPVNKFHLHSTGTTANTMRITNADTGATASDGFEMGLGSDEGVLFENYENTYMSFYTNNLERVRILNDGNVGIGKTNPGQKLDVVGNINVPAGSCFMVNGACLVSSSGGDITAVNAGTGLSGGGASGDVTLSADTGYLQRRVSGTCGAGSSVRVVNSDGTVACETDDVGLTSESDTFDAVTARGATSNRSIYINSGYVYAYNNSYPIRLGELWGHTGLYNGSASHIMYFGSDQYFQFLNRSGSYGPGVYAQDYYSNAAGVWMSQLCRSNGTNCPSVAGLYLPLAGGTMAAGSTITFNGNGSYGVGVGSASSNKNSIAVDTLETDPGGTLELNYYGGGEVHVGSGGSKALRTSIIYDGNNGAYYVDPNGTSRMNTLNYVDQAYIVDVRPQYMYDWNDSAYYIDMNNTSRFNYLGRNYGWNWTEYDWNDTTYYMDLNSVSVLNDLRVNILYDRQNTAYYVDPNGTSRMNEIQADRVYGFADIRSPIFYDYNDTGYYVDPNGTSNLNRITNRTRASFGNNGLYNTPRWDYTGDTRYWTGAMGWGTTDFNTIYSNWGSGFFDTWSNPGNAPGGSSHYVGMQGFHFNYGDGTNAYGFQMAMAGEANNRFFWRSGWPSPRAWVEMIHSGNIGSQSVNYANTAGSLSNMNISQFTNNSGYITGVDTSGLVPKNAWWGSTYYGSNGDIYLGFWSKWLSTDLSERATHRGEGTNYIDYSRYVYNNGAYSGSGWMEPSSLGVYYAYLGRLVYNNGAYSGSGWVEPSDLGVRYAASAGNASTLGGLGAGSFRQFNTWQNNHYSGTDGAEYATIFYDTNNGAYYVDPNGTSRMNTLNYVDQAYIVDVRPQYMYDWNDSAYYIDMNNTSRFHYLGRNYGWNWTEYDWNNAAYYMDLDQTSRLNALYANTFIYNSDESLKKDVKTIPNALEKMLKLRGVEFNWKEDERPGIGLVAQEVEQVFPELVHAEPQSGLKAVEYGNLVAPLIEAVKELKAENDSLRARVEKLEAEN